MSLEDGGIIFFKKCYTTNICIYYTYIFVDYQHRDGSELRGTERIRIMPWLGENGDRLPLILMEDF